MNKIVKSAALAVVLGVSGLAANAAPLAPGVYNTVDIAYAPEAPVSRSVWTSPNMVVGGGANNLWSFTSGIFDFSDGTTATLIGSAENTGDTSLTFDFSLSFNNAQLKNIVGNGYCQFDGSGGICQNPGDSSYIDVTEQWTFFDYIAGGTLTGTGGAINGLTYSLVSNPGHLPQAGLDANALVDADRDGFSMWYHWTLDSARCANASSFSSGGVTLKCRGNGDINTHLQPVPLPAAGWLLVAGLGGLAAMRRKAG